jgi:putative MFS transporter
VSVNVAKRLDALSLTRFHYRLIAVGGLGILFDSFDVGLLSFVLAALISAWHLNPSQIGLIASINLGGMAVGAALAGTWSDRWGRRQVFMLTLLVYSVASGLSGLSVALWMLLLLRFVVGLGLGGELPVTTTLVTEFLPTALRGRGIILLESFWALGAIVAALLAVAVIPDWGWRSAFFLSVLPALYVLYLRRGIPESPRYLTQAGAPGEAARVVDLVAGTVPAHASGAPRAESPGVGALFSRTWRGRTVVLWILWLMMNFAYYGMFLWLPSVLVERGFSLVTSLQYTLIMILIQLPGYWSAAWLVDRWGRKTVLIVYLVLAAAAAGMFGVAHSVTEVLVFGGALSFFDLGAWGVTYTYTVEHYPTLLRGTGTGWAMGVGRIGGIVGPSIVGALLASHTPVPSVFVIFTVAMMVAALAVLIGGRETTGRTLEELAGDELAMLE